MLRPDKLGVYMVVRKDYIQPLMMDRLDRNVIGENVVTKVGVELNALVIQPGGMVGGVFQIVVLGLTVHHLVGINTKDTYNVPYHVTLGPGCVNKISGIHTTNTKDP